MNDYNNDNIIEKTDATAFAELGINDNLISALSLLGYENPSPIQQQCIPIFLQGNDLLGVAQTGTGKTAAFSLPILQNINLAKKSPQALILAPTRELALQVAESLQSYAKFLPGFHVLPIYGGQAYNLQLRQLSRGAQVIVGTPGRIMDHIERKTLKLDNLKTIILDEADEMLRMGFIEDVEWILEHVPENHQTGLFSATMPEQIKKVAQKYLKNPTEVKIKSATATVESISQKYWIVSGLHKLDALTRILEVEDDLDATIIFVRTKTQTAELADKLSARGYAAAALNGDLNQAMRERVIEQLKNGSLDIVIATDVAARGIDVPRISHVINYDIPYDTESYVHRIGRTGRAGRSGHAILFVSPRETRLLKSIERATRQKISAITLPTRADVTMRRVAGFKEKIAEVMEKQNLDFFRQLVSQMSESDNESENADLLNIAAALAFMAQQNRPLQIPGEDPPPYERNRKEQHERKISKNEKYEKNNKKDKPQLNSDYAGNAFAMTKYRIDVGRNHGVQVKDIVGAFANETGLQSRYIGRIGLYEESSTIELPSGMPKATENLMQRIRIKGLPINLRRDGSNEEYSGKNFKNHNNDSKRRNYKNRERRRNK